MKKLLLLLTALFCCYALRAVSPSGTLPILHINTKNEASVTSKEKYVDATYWLETKGVDNMGSDLGAEDSPLSMQIRGRGNYTWTGFDKKPYRLKLGKKAAMLGMNSSKHWALLAHADDSRGFLRNALGFELSRLVGMSWTPDSKPCEVLLNGDYIGLYFLTETVRVDKNRVNVVNGDDEVEDWLEANSDKEWTDYPFTPLDNTGGWLVEIDNYDDADQVKVPTLQTNETVLRITYDTPSDYITADQKQWLSRQFIVMDSLIYNHADWSSYIDIPTAAKFFIINQLTGNYESYHGSCKLYRQRGDAEKWMFGPVWDFGSAFQKNEAMARWIWQSPFLQHWIENMYKDEAFQAEVKRLYKQLMEGNYKELVTYAESFINLIREAAARDYQRWPEYGNSDLDADLADVKVMLEHAVSFCNRQFGYTQPNDYNNLSLYLRGFNGWDINSDYRFKYTGNNAVFTLNVKNFTGEFKISGTDWDAYDMGFGQKGTQTDDFPIDIPTELTRVGANMHISRTIPDATLILDFASSTLTLSTNGYDSVNGIETDVDQPVYYTLQGVRVENPSAGIYIVIRGKRATKEYIGATL